MAGWEVVLLFVPFKRTDAVVASGQAHAIVGQNLVGWRADRYRYSQPLFYVEPAYFTLKGRPAPPLVTFGDAARTDVVVVLGDALRDELSGRGIPSMEVPDLQGAVQMLRRGRMTAILSLRRPVEAALANAGMTTEVEIHVIEHRPIHLALDRRLPWGEEFLVGFDDALLEMRDSGRIRALATAYFDIW